MNLKHFNSPSSIDKFASFLRSNNSSDSTISRKLSAINSFSQYLKQRQIIAKPIGTSLRVEDTSLPNSTSLRAGGEAISPVTSPTILPSFFNKYLIWSTIILIILGSLFGLYTQIINNARKQLAYSTASSPTIGARILSFQGRLTDSSGNPIVSSTGIIFKLFNSDTGGTQLYSSDTGNSQTVIPDENGIFNTIIGKSHGDTIPSSVFTENAQVYLEITTDAETMTPRQQIATVAYALNAETLQGLPPSASGLKNTVLVIGESGNIYLGETSPSIISTSGTFGLEGQALLLKASDGSGGNITINPDGNGVIRFVTEGTTPAIGGFFDISNANIATGNLFNSQINNTNRGYNFLDFSNYNVGTTTVASRFTISAGGNLTVGGSATFTGLAIGTTGTGTTGVFIDTSGNLYKNIFGSLAFADTAVGTTYTFTNGLTNTSNTISLGGTLTSNAIINTSSNSLSFLGLGNTQSLFIGATGYVGIGTTNPGYKLEVNGTGYFANQLTVSDPTLDGGTLILGRKGGQPSIKSAGYLIMDSGTNSLALNYYSSSNILLGNGGGKTGIGPIPDSTLGSILSVKGNLSVGSSYWATAAPTGGMIVEGNVGIGTTSPKYKLEVNGSALVTSFGIGATDSNYSLHSTAGGRFDTNLSVGTTTDTGSLNLTGVTDIGGSNVVSYLVGTTGLVGYLDTTGWDKSTTDDYSSWNLLANSVGTTAITTGANVNFINGVGISLSQTGSAITINNTGIGTTYSAGSGLTLLSNVFKLGGALTENMRLNIGDTEALFVNFANGFLGVGTTNPLVALHVEGQCVTGDTLLKRRKRRKNKNGEWVDEYEDVRIDQIKVGDEILTLDEKTGRFVLSAVEGLMDMGIQQTYLLITSSGKQIRTTGNHPYLTQKDTRTPFIIGGTYQVDQSPRIENMSKNSFFAIANDNIQYVSKLTKADKQKIKKIYQKNNQTKYFGVETFAYALVHTITNMKIMSAKLEIDLEYIGHESRIIEIITRYHPTIEIIFTSIGHDSKKSPAHIAAYSAYLGKRKENLTIKNDRSTNKLVGQGVVTLIPLNQTGNTCDQIKTSYQFPLDMSNTSSWKKVFDLKPGIQIATQDGWETIVVLKKFAREHTYDIQVAHTHNFVGNNIIAHNTFLNGNVGIGSTNPLYKLNVGGTANFTNLFASSNVGIGTTAPSKKLQVDDSQVWGLFKSTTGTNYGLLNVNNTGGNLYLGLESSTGGGLITGSAVYSAVIAHTGNYPMHFATNNAIRMTVSNGGNVGIGTTAPASALDVIGSIRASTTFDALRSGATSGDAFSINGVPVLSRSTTAVQFLNNSFWQTASFFTNANEQMRITSTGLVGIGTTNPLYTLQIGGTGTLGVGGTITFSGLAIGTTGAGSTAVFTDASGNLSKNILGSLAFSSATYDNYVNWGLQSNSGTTTPVTSGLNVNFINGVGISISQVGTSITITNNGIGTTYSATNGLSAISTNVFGLGGTLTQNTSIGLSSSSLTFAGSFQSLFLDSTGYVGVGLSVGISAPLHVGTTASDQLSGYFKGYIAAQKFIDLDNYANYYLDLANASNTSSSLALERSGSIRFNSTYNVGATNWQYIQNGPAVKIQSIYDAGNSNGGLFLATATIGTSASNIGTSWDSGLWISGKAGTTGYVGIGTTAPEYKLEVNGDALISTRLGIGSTNILYALNVGNTANFNNLFTTGSIGIGTTAPTAKLQVNGDASAITSIFRANATTPGNLTEWQNSSGTALAHLTSTGSIGLIGNTSAPAVHHTTDTDTGIAFDGNGSVIITSNGTQTAKYNGTTHTIGTLSAGIPQSLTIQGVTAGTTNTPGSDILYRGSDGLGDKNGGKFIWYTSTGTTTSGAITLNSQQIVNKATPASTFSIGQTIASNGNRLLIVQIGYGDTAPVSTSVTYGGVALTLANRTTRSTIMAQEVWYLVAPAIGSTTVVITPSTTTTAKVGIQSWYNVRQDAPIGIGVSATGLSTGPATVTASPPTSNYLTLDFVSKQNTGETIAADASQTEINKLSSATGFGGSMGSSSKTNGTAMSWTWASASRNWIEVAIPIAPSSETPNTFWEKFAITPTEIVINDTGDSLSDFRVEGDTDSSLFFTDASTDKIGIGTTAPSTKLDIVTSDTITDNISNVLTLTHNLSTGTATGGSSDTYTKALLHADGADASATFTDDSGKTWTAGGNAQIDTAQSEFGGSSALFDGGSDYVDTPDNTDFDVGSGDFTIDTWIRLSASGATRYLAGQEDNASTTTDTSIEMWSSTADLINCRVYSGSTAYVVTSTTSIYNAWHHVACVRDGATLRIFVDGVQEDTANVTGVTVNNSAYKFAIGTAGEYLGGSEWAGWIDEFRFSKGIARWTSAFTPPSSAYTYNTNTGIGTGLLFRTQNASDTTQDSARISGTLINAIGGSEASSIVFETRSAGSTLARTMRLWNTGDLTISGWLSQDSNPDVAENIIVTDPSIQAGDVVMLDSNYIPDQNSNVYNRTAVTKANTPYSKKILGVISTNPGIILNAPESGIDNKTRSEDNERPLTLVGRVPINIDPDSEPFSPGDMLTASEKPGFAQKATQTGYVVGKALEFWPRQNTDNSQSLVFVNLSWYDHDIELTPDGQITVNYNVSPEVLSSLGYNDSKNEIENAIYSAKINTGLVKTINLIAQNILAQKVIAPEIKTTTITPLDEITDTVVIDGNLKAKEASFSTVYADQIINQEGNISDVMAQKIADLRAEITGVIASASAAITSPESTPSAIALAADTWDTSIATQSATIDVSNINISDSLIIGANLIVNGQTNLSKLYVSDTLAIGQIAIKDNIIETTASELLIQPSGVGSVNILNSRLIVSDDGSVTINAKLAGTDATFSGSLIANMLEADSARLNSVEAAVATIGKLNITTNTANLIVAVGESVPESTASAIISSNATAGTVTLSAGTTAVTINNPKLSSNSMIYLTPNGSTQNQVVYIKNKDIGGSIPTFAIGIDSTLPTDLSVNWWIIN